MSLINKLLNELEKRKKIDARYAKAVSRIAQNITTQPQKLKQIIIVSFLHRWPYFLAVCLLLVSIIGYYQIRDQKIAPSAKEKVKFTASNTPKTILKPVPAKPQPTLPNIKLHNIMLKQENNQTIIDFILSAPTIYYVENSSPQHITIDLKNTTLPGNLPLNLENSFVKAFSTKQNKDSITSEITLLPKTKISNVQLLKKPKNILRLTLTNTQHIADTVKTPVPLSPAEQAQERYLTAQQALAKGNYDSAIHKLHLLLGDFPNHNQARTMLVSLLLKENKLDKAQAVLAVGLRKYRDYLPFIKLKARILTRQENTAAALTLLQQHANIATNDVEYLALLANLYQQQDSFILAASLYNQLTKLQPQKTIWWLGLGAALENAGKINAAQEAYQNAHNAQEQSPEVSAFLNSRVRR